MLLFSCSIQASKPGGEGNPVAYGSNSLGIDLYRNMAGEEGNLFFSPFSIYQALTIVAEGAGHETMIEFGNVLRFPEARSSSHTDLPWDMSIVRKTLRDIERGISSEHVEEIRNALEDLDRKYMDAIATPYDTGTIDDAAKYYRDIKRREEEAYGRLMETRDSPPRFELEIANSLWIQKELPLKKEYLQTVREYYTGNEIFTESDLIKAQAQINAWISERTKGRIRDAYRASRSDDYYLRLAVINAIYFLGDWQEPFNDWRTTERDYILASLDTVQTTTMVHLFQGVAGYAAFNEDGSYFDTPDRIHRGQTEGLYPGAKGFFILELPYKDCGLSMIVVAPQSPDGLGEIESSLSLETLSLWISMIERRNVHVMMPKFRIDYERQFRPDLEKIGLTSVFDSLEADLSGISEEQLYVSSVFHKAYLRVDEQGTEAAAATVVKIDVTASQMPELVPFTPIFKADRPFLFAVRDRGSSLIFFIGRVVDPRSGSALGAQMDASKTFDIGQQ